MGDVYSGKLIGDRGRTFDEIRNKAQVEIITDNDNSENGKNVEKLVA